MDQIDYIKENVLEASKYILAKIKVKPDIAIILGSGMSDAIPDLADQTTLLYEDIPHFPESRVAGHRGELLSGRLDDKSVFIMRGRFHYYEGFTMRGATFPVLVLANLGIKRLVVTNAAGGISKNLSLGDFMLIKDHINLMGDNPLIGPNDDSMGTRFVDLSDAYDESMLAVAEATAKAIGIRCRRGVLAAVTGPCYETPAEVNILRNAGADAVTMSTVPEVIMARFVKIRVLGISLISNVAGKKGRLSHEDVLAEASRSEAGLKKWLKELILGL